MCSGGLNSPSRWVNVSNARSGVAATTTWCRTTGASVIGRGRAIAGVLVVCPLIALSVFAVQEQRLNAAMAGCAVPGAFAVAYAIREGLI